jgi:lipopolysaccharide transport system permease protein
MAAAPAHSPAPTASALTDWLRGTARIGSWLPLAWYDIRLRYRRSMLGPLWLTISMGAMLLGMGPLYAALFNVPMDTFFPHLALGLVLWMFISGTIVESCGVFTQSASYLKHADTPLSLFVWRLEARQIVQLAHHALLYVPIAWWAGIRPSPVMLLFIPGFLILVLFLHALALALGIICARFRDVSQIVASLIGFLLFLTPVVWQPDKLPERLRFVLNNPFAVLLALVREPLLGKIPSADTWAMAVGWTIAVAIVAFLVFAWKRRQVVYWV